MQVLNHSELLSIPFKIGQSWYMHHVYRNQVPQEVAVTQYLVQWNLHHWGLCLAGLLIYEKFKSFYLENVTMMPTIIMITIMTMTTMPGLRVTREAPKGVSHLYKI